MKSLRKILILLFVLSFLSVNCIQAFAEKTVEKQAGLEDDGVTPKEPEFDEDQEAKAEKKTFEYNPVDGITVVPWDLRLDPSSTFVFQGTPDPNVKGARETGTSWVVYYDFTKKLGDWGIAFFELKQGIGRALANSLDLFNGVNYNYYDDGGNLKARTFWYKQFLFDKQVSILWGKVLARGLFSQSAYAGDDDKQFLGYIFNESPAIEWPADYAFTINTQFRPKEIDFMEFEFNYWEGDSDWEKVFEGGIYTAQVNLKPSELFNLDKTQWDGNYRFGAWLNTRFHEKLVKSGAAPSSDTKEFNYGFSLSCDQMITDVYGAFLRCGFGRPDLIPAGGGVTVGFSWSAGGQMKGTYWGRENDVLAIGVGQVIPSKEYADAGNPAKSEGHLEAYYSCAITDYLFISPDLQLVWSPDGAPASTTDPVFVYGFRVHADF